MSVVREYLSRSSFHGLHYLVDDNLHWTERLFWIICVISSWGGSVYLMYSTVEFAHNNPTTLSIDTHYLRWTKAPLPAIIVCETNSPKVSELIKNPIWVDTVLQMVYFDYYMSYDYIYNYTDDISYYKSFRSTCDELFNYCEWNNQEFNCCTAFLPIETAYGTCFAVNSIQTNHSYSNVFLSRKPGKLTLEFENPCVKIYAVSSDEIVTEKDLPLVLQKDLYAYTEYKVFISMQQTISDANVRDIDIARRKCRFPDENNLTVARKYSFAACNLQCQKRAHLILYNCTHHYMPFVAKEEICNETQLIKLAKNLDEWNELAQSDCDCELSCDKTSVLFLGRVVQLETQTVELKKSTTKTHVMIQCEPAYDKIIRTRAKTILDNIVSLGGTAGLLVGASILSVLELIYYFTIRAIDSRLMRIKARKKKLINKKITVVNVYPFVK